jgi:hypothetical protein
MEESVTFKQLETLLKGEGPKKYEETLGQMWLERRSLLARINALPTAEQEEGALHELRNLRRRVNREGMDDYSGQRTCHIRGDLDRVSDEEVEKRW